jgi:7,8-dihydro-6-hydroxymethylpterin dimethyltransferase
MTCCQPRLHLGLTESVCPVCLATIPAERVAEGGTVYLKKTCPEHGTTSTPVWRGLDSYLRWGEAARTFSSPSVCATEVKRGCPHDCGLCPDHRQQSCCVLLEVTSRCDLACPVCYASAGRQGADASFDEIGGWLDTLAEAGGRVHIQLSGGEPTVRDDLPEVVELIRSRGFEFVQLNTNGVRIAREPDYLAGLAKAGLDCVFLQFDGVSDDVYQRLRGAKLMRLKTAAIRNCGAAGIGVVLTPTLVPGVNADQIGAIVDFAVQETPAVRAVHFQPVSYFGRCLTPPEDASRITLPEVMEALIAHSGGTIQHEDFHPGSAENPYCSFSGRFAVGEDGALHGSAEKPPSCCGVPAKQETQACCGSAKPSQEVARARRYVAGQWTRPDSSQDVPGLDAFDAFLAGRTRTLGLSGMAFQDAWTLDLDRLRQCHIHVVAPDRRVIPFCAYNLTDCQGRALYRPQAGSASEEV